MRDGRIVEDWTGFDSLALLRQLGIVRTRLTAPRLIAAVHSAGSQRALRPQRLDDV
jgi:hypothetical protein